MTVVGGGAVGWSSKRQGLVTLSTTEAEYMAACAAGTEVMWMRHFLSELGYAPQGPSVILMDNQSAIAVGKNPEHHGRMKHIQRRFYWLREAVESKALRLEFVPTSQMVADALTKPLERQKVIEFRRLMGLVE